jgi:hypothetical protein
MLVTRAAIKQLSSHQRSCISKQECVIDEIRLHPQRLEACYVKSGYGITIWFFYFLVEPSCPRSESHRVTIRLSESPINETGAVSFVAAGNVETNPTQ